MIRIGLGYDLHILTTGRALMIGGIHIPFDKGELGHSDGDALLHAITDALLGAAGLGDIGSFFPPTDPTWKDVPSSNLLRIAWQRVQKEGWHLENADCVVALEQPKLLPYRDSICQSIAAILNIPSHRVFVKAKTGEGIGSIGSGNAIAAWCVCLISRQVQE